MDTVKLQKGIYIPKDIQILLFLTVVLNIVRMIVFQSSYFDYILWNIFLAVVPFVISIVLLNRSRKGTLRTSLFIIGGVLWLLALPNAPYIVTDLIHIGKGHGAPVLYDTFLLFSSAWVGMILFLHSLSHMEEIIVRKFTSKYLSSSIALIIFLCSVGIYIGRYLRFNSWDIFTDMSFFGDTLRTLSHPTHFTEACLFIVPCFFFTYLSYRAWKEMKRG